MAEQPQQIKAHFTDEILDNIEQIVQTHGPSLLKAQEGMRESINLSRGIARLKDLMSLALVAEDILPLMNSRLGFLTDRPNKRHAQPYDVAVVRDVLVEAMLRGARVAGNEFNIISCGCYLTKAYFERKVGEFPGVTNVVPTPGVAQMVGDGALVPFTVRWLLNGKKMVEERIERGKRGADGYLDERIPVKVQAGMGADAIAGKAERKIMARVYKRLTGATAAIPDGAVDDLVGDSSRRSRDHATVDLGAFKPSAEPNRGHGDTGMDRVTKPAEPETKPEPAPEPEKPQAESPAAQYLTCEHCALHFGSAEHLESHQRIAHPESQVKPPTVEEMRTELRALVTEMAGLTGKDMRQVTPEERETVWGIFDALTDGQARATNDIPEAMLPDVLVRARTMLEGQVSGSDPSNETFEA